MARKLVAVVAMILATCVLSVGSLAAARPQPQLTVTCDAVGNTVIDTPGGTYSVTVDWYDATHTPVGGNVISGSLQGRSLTFATPQFAVSVEVTVAVRPDTGARTVQPCT